MSIETRKGYPKIPCDQTDCRYEKGGYCVGFLVDGAECPNLTDEDRKEFGIKALSPDVAQPGRKHRSDIMEVD